MDVLRTSGKIMVKRELKRRREKFINFFGTREIGGTEISLITPIATSLTRCSNKLKDGFPLSS